MMMKSVDQPVWRTRNNHFSQSAAKLEAKMAIEEE
jgi:hypothetical protein